MPPDLFKSALQQQVPELQLARAVHRLGQRLVAVAQVGGEPAGGAGYFFLLRPAAVGQGNRRIGTVFSPG